MQITNEQIEEATTELCLALQEANLIDKQKLELSEKERLNRTRLLQAKEAIRSLRCEW